MPPAMVPPDAALSTALGPAPSTAATLALSAAALDTTVAPSPISALGPCTASTLSYGPAAAWRPGRQETHLLPTNSSTYSTDQPKLFN